MPVHIFVGCFAVFGTLLSIITGILSLAYRGDNAAPKDTERRAAQNATGLCGHGDLHRPPVKRAVRQRLAP